MADTRDNRQRNARALLVLGCSLVAAGVASAASRPEALLAALLCALGTTFVAVSALRMRSQNEDAEIEQAAGPEKPARAPAPSETDARPVAPNVPKADIAPEAADTAETSPAAAPAEGRDADREHNLQVESLLLRSTDVASSLADLLRSDEAPCELREVLERLGLGFLASAPKFEALRNEHNDRWAMWYAGDLPYDDYDRMEAIELALNVADHLRLSPACAPGLPMEERLQAAFAMAAAPQAPACCDAAARPYARGAEKDGEWSARLNITSFAKGIRSDVRMDILYQVNVADGIAVVDLEVPRPAAFELLSHEKDERAALARTFAMRTCLLMGRGVFKASARLSRAVVNGHEHGTHTPVISLDLTPSGLERLGQELESLGCGELPRGLGIRWHVSADGSLAPVEAFMERWDDAIAPLSRWGDVEENRLPAPEAVAAACKATAIRDLGINEKSVRISAWNEAVGWLGNSTRRAVAAFEARRKKASDSSVAEACARVSRALVEGDVDVFDRRSMALLFVDGGELTGVVRSTATQLNRQPAHTAEELEEAVERLERALEPAAQTARYEDDTENIYRYFNSTAERVRYNRTVTGDGRELRLVPDEYYAAHTQAAAILVALGRPEQALPHADEVVRVAPVSPGAALARVRVLEELSRIYEARDMLKDAVGYASTLGDLSICLYRLAFMEWKLGRAKTSIACYQRAADLNTEVRDRALKEMRDVIEAGQGLSALSEDEVRAELEDAQIPYGDAENIRAMAREAAIACTDAGLFYAARTLTGVLLEIDGDDVLQDVYGSLLPTRP